LSAKKLCTAAAAASSAAGSLIVRGSAKGDMRGGRRPKDE
jgi:hypothetical protein